MYSTHGLEFNAHAWFVSTSPVPLRQLENSKYVVRWVAMLRCRTTSTCWKKNKTKRPSCSGADKTRSVNAETPPICRHIIAMLYYCSDSEWNNSMAYQKKIFSKSGCLSFSSILLIVKLFSLSSDIRYIDFLQLWLPLRVWVNRKKKHYFSFHRCNTFNRFILYVHSIFGRTFCIYYCRFDSANT